MELLSLLIRTSPPLSSASTLFPRGPTPQNRYEPKAQHQILLLRITEQGKTLSYPSVSGTSRSHLRDGLCLLGPPSSDPNILEFTDSFFVSYLKIPHFRSNKRMSTVTPSPLKQFLNQHCSYI